MIGPPQQHVIGTADVPGLEKGSINDPVVSPVIRNGDRRVGGFAKGSGTSETTTLASLTDPHSPAFALLAILVVLILWRGRVDLALRGAVGR